VIVPPAGMQTGRGGVLHYFRRGGEGGGARERPAGKEKDNREGES